MILRSLFKNQKSGRRGHALIIFSCRDFTVFIIPAFGALKPITSTHPIHFQLKIYPRYWATEENNAKWSETESDLFIYCASHRLVIRSCFGVETTTKLSTYMIQLKRTVIMTTYDCFHIESRECLAGLYDSERACDSDREGGRKRGRSHCPSSQPTASPLTRNIVIRCVCGTYICKRKYELRSITFPPVVG